MCPFAEVGIAGRATVRSDSANVGVQVVDAAGNPADLPFHVVVTC